MGNLNGIVHEIIHKNLTNLHVNQNITSLKSSSNGERNWTGLDRLDVGKKIQYFIPKLRKST